MKCLKKVDEIRPDNAEKKFDIFRFFRFYFISEFIFNFFKMAQLEAQVAAMQLKLDAQKILQREAAIKAEVGRHKLPQIKVVFSRASSFLFLIFLF